MVIVPNKYNREKIVNEPDENVVIECINCCKVSGKTLDQNKWKISGQPLEVTYTWEELCQSKCHAEDHHWTWRKNAWWDSKVIEGKLYYWDLSKPEEITRCW